MKLLEMDSLVPIRAQLGHDETGIVLINIFTVDPKEAESLVAAWSEDAGFMKMQPGFISTQLHRGIAGSSTFVNYAVWEDTSAFRAAFTHPDFRNSLSKYPSSTVATPHLFKKIAVKGICVT